MDNFPLPPVEAEINPIEVDEDESSNVDMPNLSDVSGEMESENESDYEGGELFKLAESMLGNAEMETGNNDFQLPHLPDLAEMGEEDMQYASDYIDNENEESSNDSFQDQGEFSNEYSYSTEDTSAYMSPDSNYVDGFENVGPSVVSNQMQQFYYEEETGNYTYSLYIQRFTQFQAVAQMANEEVRNEENEEDEIVIPGEHGELREEEKPEEQMESDYHDDNSSINSTVDMPDSSDVSVDTEFANERIDHESFDNQSDGTNKYSYVSENLSTYISLEPVNFNDVVNVDHAEVSNHMHGFYQEEEPRGYHYSETLQFQYNYPEGTQHMRYYEEEQNENVVHEDEEIYNREVEEEDIEIPEERDDIYEKEDDEPDEDEEEQYHPLVILDDNYELNRDDQALEDLEAFQAEETSTDGDIKFYRRFQ